MLGRERELAASALQVAIVPALYSARRAIDDVRARAQRQYLQRRVSLLECGRLPSQRFLLHGRARVQV